MYNPVLQSIICEQCHRTLVYPADEDAFTQAPYFKPSGETFCNELHLHQWTAAQEQAWRDMLEGKQRQDDEDLDMDEISHDSNSYNCLKDD